MVFRSTDQHAWERARTLFAVILFLILVPSAAYSQERDSVGQDDPAPYEADEFPRWARDLRRAEIVALGVYPISYLFTSLCYDLLRFTKESIAAGTVATEYAPLFFAPPDAPGYDRDERRGIFIASISVSALVALADYVLGRISLDSESSER